jgi:hypothetical protein
MWPTIGLKILETKKLMRLQELFSPLGNCFQLSTLKDHLYFKDVATISSQQIIAPAQYGKTINYVSVKLNKEFTFGKFALDNTILYQKSINRITF